MKHKSKAASLLVQWDDWRPKRQHESYYGLSFAKKWFKDAEDARLQVEKLKFPMFDDWVRADLDRRGLLSSTPKNAIESLTATAILHVLVVTAQRRNWRSTCKGIAALSLLGYDRGLPTIGMQMALIAENFGRLAASQVAKSGPRRAAKARHAIGNEIGDEIFTLYQEGSYKSIRQAAKILAPIALDKGQAKGHRFSQDRIEITIADWIRKRKKQTKK